MKYRLPVLLSFLLIPSPSTMAQLDKPGTPKEPATKDAARENDKPARSASDLQRIRVTN